MCLDCLENLPSPAPVLGIACEAIRDEEGFDSFRATKRVGLTSESIHIHGLETCRSMYRASMGGGPFLGMKSMNGHKQLYWFGHVLNTLDVPFSRHYLRNPVWFMLRSKVGDLGSEAPTRRRET